MLMYLPLKMQFGTSWGLKCKMEHFLYPSLVSVELELIYTSSLYFLLNLVYFMLTMPKESTAIRHNMTSEDTNTGYGPDVFQIHHRTSLVQ